MLTLMTLLILTIKKY